MGLPAELGTEIRDYRLDSVLGQGGMGCVYAATHQVLGRQVAIKVLAAELASSDEYVSRFEHEARIVNGVRSPNIVDIHDFIKEGGLVAYVMEYVEGPSLGRFLKDGPLTVRQAVNVTFQLASALEAVHSVGVIHRDLKPDNVLVLGTRQTDLAGVPSVKILDFGIAKSTQETTDHKTVTGSMLGTPTYMAPEQVAAEAVSPATDVYALAEILYEMVSGQRVFHGDRMAILQQKLVGGPPQLSWPEVPGWQTLDNLVRHGLQARPEHRLSISDLVTGLNDVLGQQPDAPQPTPVMSAYPAPVASTPAPPPRMVSSVEAHTPVNMQSVIALPAPRSPLSRLALPVGAVMLLAGVAVVAATWMQRSPLNQIDAQPVAPMAAAQHEDAPAAAPEPSPNGVAAVPAPAAVQAEPKAEPEAAKVEPAAPAPKKKAVKRKRRRRASKRARRTKATPPATKPAPAAPETAPKPAAPTVVKRSTIPSW